MRRFDYSFLKNGRVPASFLNLASVIYSLKERGKYRFKENPGIYEALEKIARFQSVKSSNAIEGIVSTDPRIAMILAGSAEPISRDEKEIAGYKDALAMVHKDYEKLDFRREDMLMLHKTMLSEAKPDFAGEYKKSDNLIVEIDSLGNRKLRFRPASAKETPAAMEQLELAYMDARSESGINELLLIPCAILDFLCIHPFLDGNGRISRLLSLLLLYKEGFDVGKYISFEGEIEKRKDQYYEALRLSSIGWEKNENDYFPFVEDFLSTLYHCYKELDDRFSLVVDGKATKAKRVEALVLSRITPISKTEICEFLPDVSPTTVEAVLGKLVKEEKIRKIGLARGSRYIAKH